MMGNCYNLLEYFMWDTKMLISQRNVNLPIENDYVGALYSLNNVEYWQQINIFLLIFLIILWNESWKPFHKHRKIKI